MHSNLARADRFVARQFGDNGDRIVTKVDTSVPDFPMLMTIDDAAVMLATTRISISKAIKAGELPIVTLHGRDRIVTGKLLEKVYTIEGERLARLKAGEQSKTTAPVAAAVRRTRPRST